LKERSGRDINKIVITPELRPINKQQKEQERLKKLENGWKKYYKTTSFNELYTDYLKQAIRDTQNNYTQQKEVVVNKLSEEQKRWEKLEKGWKK
jgi:hypothetical protein